MKNCDASKIQFNNCWAEDYVAKRNGELAKGISHRLQFVIVPSFKCNYQCSYCFEGTKITHQCEVMTDETIDKTIEFILNRVDEKPEIEYVALQFYGGEPLLNMDIIIKITTELRKLCPKPVRVYITSNGRYLTPENADRLLELDVQGIEIAIEGLKETYAKIKKCNASDFDKVIENIRYACQKGLKITAILKYGYKIQNVQNFKRLLNLLISENAGNLKINTSPILKYNASDQFEYLSPKEMNATRIKLIGYIKSLGKQPPPYVPYQGSGFIACIGEDRNHFIIAPNGDLYRCEHKIGIKEYCVGNINTYIGKDESAFQIESILFGNKNELPNKCLSCISLPVCNGYCSIDRFNNVQTIDCDAQREMVSRFKE